jgi:hypothetical protein
VLPDIFRTVTAPSVSTSTFKVAGLSTNSFMTATTAKSVLCVWLMRQCTLEHIEWSGLPPTLWIRIDTTALVVLSVYGGFQRDESDGVIPRHVCDMRVRPIPDLNRSTADQSFSSRSGRAVGGATNDRLAGSASVGRAYPSSESLW